MLSMPSILHGIYCKSCCGIINPKATSSFFNHIKTKHPNIKLHKSAKDELMLRCTKLGIMDISDISVDVSGIAPLEGILVESGYGCRVQVEGTQCLVGTTSQSDMEHHIATHSNIL